MADLVVVAGDSDFIDLCDYHHKAPPTRESGQSLPLVCGVVRDFGRMRFPLRSEESGTYHDDDAQ